MARGVEARVDASSRRRAAPRAGVTAAKRNPERTREKILNAARTEFCRAGLSGARVEQIVRRAGTNMRMLYHYFGDKEGLYLAVLERVYERIRGDEEKLNLHNLGAVDGMVRLIDFTFSHFLRNPEFITLIGNENLMKAKYLKRSRRVAAMTSPLVSAIRHLLERGEREGVFRKDVDPLQIYVTMVAMSYFHVSNRHTLSTIFRTDLSDQGWLEARRSHAREMILGYLSHDRVV